jgi:hypothetical protein
MDLLIQEIVGSSDSGCRSTPLPPEIEILIQAVDDHNDDLFHAAHFARLIRTLFLVCEGKKNY